MAVQRKQTRIDQLEKETHEVVQEELSDDLVNIISSANGDMEKLENDSFKKMFWKQQVHIRSYVLHMQMHAHTHTHTIIIIIVTA